MAGVTLLGWRAQPPTPYSHLTNGAYGHPYSNPKRTALPAPLPRDHRFRRATAVRHFQRAGTGHARGGGAATSSRPVSSSARTLRPLQGRVPPPADATKISSPPQRQHPQPEPQLQRIGTRLGPSLAPLALELPPQPQQPQTAASGQGTDSPRRSTISRGGSLKGSARGLRPVRQRVQLVDVPNVSSAAAPSPPGSPPRQRDPSGNAEPIKLAALPSSLSVNSQWGPKKTIIVPASQQHQQKPNKLPGNLTRNLPLLVLYGSILL